MPGRWSSRRMSRCAPRSPRCSERFAELTSARQVVLSLRARRAQAPAAGPRERPGPPGGTLATGPCTRSWSKPAYAGAYVFGRTRGDKTVEVTGRVLDPGAGCGSRPMGDLASVITTLATSTGTPTWPTRARLAGTVGRPGATAGGAPRRGQCTAGRLWRAAALREDDAGWLLGRPLASCPPTPAGRGGNRKPLPAPSCQRVGGRPRRTKRWWPRWFRGARSRPSLDATAKALAETEAEHRTGPRRVRGRRWKRARYEGRARSAPVLTRWSRRTGSWSEASRPPGRSASARSPGPRRRSPRRRPIGRVSLSEDELAWLHRAGADLRAVFDAETTTMAERKAVTSVS